MVVLDVNILWMFLGTSLVVLMQAQAVRLAKTNRELAESEAALKGRNAQLDDANERLTELGVVKTQLLSNVEHEVLPPVGAIVSAAALVKGEEHATPLARQCAATILAECERLARIMETLPTTPERECRGLYWLEARVEMDRVVQDAVDCIRPIADRVGVELNCDIAADMPAVWADHDRLVHVLTTLLDNAILFSAPRGIVSVQAVARGPEILIVIAQCNGSARAFDPQLLGSRLEAGMNGSVRAVTSGADNAARNLGLRMCREIVEDRRGRIWVEPHTSGGTVFKVAFPATSYEARDASYAEA
jgi:signal transduction histidine kinase